MPSGMVFDLPDRATLDRAQLARDDRHDDRLRLLEFVDRKGALCRLGEGAVGVGRTAATERAAVERQAVSAGASARSETPLHLDRGAFADDVRDELRRIPIGKTRSDGEIARRIGRPTATRAVAHANGATKIGLMAPGRRVIGVDGSRIGHGGGPRRKRRLLEIERAHRTRQEVGTTHVASR